MKIEFYGGPRDGAVEEPPADINVSLVRIRIAVCARSSPTGKPRTETHFYRRAELLDCETRRFRYEYQTWYIS